MSKVKITPHQLRGTVTAPPSKSMAHRAIICAALARGNSTISNLTYSDDINATIGAMRALGADITTYPDHAVVNGSGIFGTGRAEINCNMSGSTLRFTVPLALAGGVSAHFTGADSLGKRPLNDYYAIMDSQGIAYSYQPVRLDLSVSGQLVPGVFTLPGDVSSQYITGLLLALPLLGGDSVIDITTPLQSKGYVDLTLQMLAEFGVSVENQNYEKFIINGNQKYTSHDYRVEGDYSGAAFFLCAGALGSDVTVQSLNPASLQGDKAILDILSQTGCTVTWVGDSVTVKKTAPLHPVTVDGRQCPDIIPVAAMVAATANGSSCFTGCHRLKIKECDRLVATALGLNTLGAQVNYSDDGMDITGTECFIGGSVLAYSDHRMAMTFAIASVASQGEIIIDDKECVSKSYPNFWQDFTHLGGIIHEC